MRQSGRILPDPELPLNPRFPDGPVPQAAPPPCPPGWESRSTLLGSRDEGLGFRALVSRVRVWI